MDNLIEMTNKETSQVHREQHQQNGQNVLEKPSSSPAFTNLDQITTSSSKSVQNLGLNDDGVVKMMMDCTMNHMSNSISDQMSPSKIQLDSGFETSSCMTGWSTNTPISNYDYISLQSHTRTQSPLHQQSHQTNNPHPPVTHSLQIQPSTTSYNQSSTSTPMDTPVIYTPLHPISNTQPSTMSVDTRTMAPSPPQIAQQQSIVYNSENNFPPNATNSIEPSQLPDVNGQTLVEEFEKIMSNTSDDVVLTNSVCLLFRFSIDSVRGYDVCQAMSSSQSIMNLLYFIINTDQYNGHELKNTMLCYATSNLTSISKFEEFRSVLLSHNGLNLNEDSSINYEKPSPGVKSLLQSLQIEDTNVIIFAITAIHNLLLDRRPHIQEMAKQQIKHGLRDILMLLDNQFLTHNHEFKLTVLDCLQILAFRNRENISLIKASDGPRLILHTIQKNLEENPTEELIETACKVLKSLSVCPDNKIDIIKYNGIEVLTMCIGTSNPDIMKTCLWTLRNLSDVISNYEAEHFSYILHLIDRILKILNDYAEESSIITCALGILANLTCNNERIKQHICRHNGVQLLMKAIGFALRETREFWTVEGEILEPAICALCHLMNQTNQPVYAEQARLNVINNIDMFQPLMDPQREISTELWKAVKKLDSLTIKKFNTINRND